MDGTCTNTVVQPSLFHFIPSHLHDADRTVPAPASSLASSHCLHPVCVFSSRHRIRYINA